MKSIKNTLYGWLFLTGLFLAVVSTDSSAATVTTMGVEISAEDCKAPFYKHNYLFIGDSRFVGMYKAGVKKKNIRWLAQPGARYSLYWQNRDDIDALDRDTIIIYELGINEMSYEAELVTLQDLETMGFDKVYYMAIMPVDEKKLLENADLDTVDFRSNKDIKTINRLIKKGLPSDMTFIPQPKIKIATKDGMHYTKATYKRWYRQIVQFVGKDLLLEEM